MFQQFKNISLNLRSLTDSVGLNEEGWRTRGLERFGAIRSELQNLNSLLTHRLEDDVESKPKEASVLELEATGQLVDRFQKEWDTIHTNNVDTIAKAKTADHLLLQLLDHCHQHDIACDQVEKSSDELSAMQVDLDAIGSAAVSLTQQLTALEARINAVLRDNQQREFEAWKQQHEAALQDEISKANQALKEREAMLEEQYQEHNRSQVQKRVELYDATFKAELDDYRRRRETEVSSLYSQHSTREETVVTTLETLKLEDSNQDDLDDFLGEEIDVSADASKVKDDMQQWRRDTHDSDSSEETGVVKILQDEDYDE